MANTKSMRYTGKAMKAFKTSDQYDAAHECGFCNATRVISTEKPYEIPDRAWNDAEHRPPARSLRQNIGTYPLTSELAPWVQNAVSAFVPDNRVLQLVKPYSERLHRVFDAERMSSSGLHDLNLIERTYQ